MSEGIDNVAAQPSDASSSSHGRIMPATRTPQASVSAQRLVRTRQLELLRHLKASLDLLYTVQIAAAYYLDNSFILLSLRLFNQGLLDRTDAQSTSDPVHMYFAILFVPSSLGLLMHLLAAVSAPGEATRGYLHGNLVLDFVGQSGPTSRLHLVLHDLLLLCLQLAYLDVCRRRRALSSSLNRRRRQATASASDGSAPSVPPSLQELDREERAGDHDQADDLVTGIMDPAASSAELNDLYSGQAALGTFWLFKIVKDKQHMDAQGFHDPTSTLRNVVGSGLGRRNYSLNIPFRS